MGAAARKQCCGGRDDGDVKELAKEKAKDENWNFLQGKAILNDLALFEQAHTNNDIPALVRLLDSKQMFAKNHTQIHPWAARPETVSSLAAFQLAQMASKENEFPCKDAIREAGGIKKLMELLQSTKLDEQQAAMVTLSFLSVENDENCIEMYNCDAMPLMVKFLHDPVEGMRGACAHTLRNIFVLDPIYRQRFVSEGGIPGLVNLLNLPPQPYDSSTLYNQSEAIYHIEDLILESGAEVPQLVALVKKAGAVQRLEKITKVDNPQLVEDAQGLLVHLAD